jgi:hypothetical protein
MNYTLVLLMIALSIGVTFGLRGTAESDTTPYLSTKGKGRGQDEKPKCVCSCACSIPQCPNPSPWWTTYPSSLPTSAFPTTGPLQRTPAPSVIPTAFPTTEDMRPGYPFSASFMSSGEEISVSTSRGEPVAALQHSGPPGSAGPFFHFSMADFPLGSLDLDKLEIPLSL